MFGATVGIPFVLGGAMCILNKPTVVSEILSTIVFCAGIVTLLQSIFGVRYDYYNDWYFDKNLLLYHKWIGIKYQNSWCPKSYRRIRFDQKFPFLMEKIYARFFCLFFSYSACCVFLRNATAQWLPSEVKVRTPLNIALCWSSAFLVEGPFVPHKAIQHRCDDDIEESDMDSGHCSVGQAIHFHWRGTSQPFAH